MKNGISLNKKRFGIKDFVLKKGVFSYSNPEGQDMKIKTLSQNNSSLKSIFVGSVVALVVSLLSILLFAFLVKLTGLNDNLIKPINQIIKIVSILIGCLVAFNGETKKTLFLGAIVGIFYIVFAFVLFSALNGEFNFSFSLVFDILFGLAVGIVCAIITNLIKRR